MSRAWGAHRERLDEDLHRAAVGCGAAVSLLAWGVCLAFSVPLCALSCCDRARVLLCVMVRLGPRRVLSSRRFDSVAKEYSPCLSHRAGLRLCHFLPGRTRWIGSEPTP